MHIAIPIRLFKRFSSYSTPPLIFLQQYTIASLTTFVEAEIGCSISDYTFSFQGRPVDAVRHGRQLTLKDCSIKAKSSLILIKMGFVLDITNPKVCGLLRNVFRDQYQL